MNTNEYLTAFYADGDEDSRLLSRAGTVEFTTTMHFIEKYLHPGARIIEIGAGTGRYSHALAQMGYAVDAVELMDSNIEIFKKHTQPGEAVTVTQGNALDLSAFAGERYDITLLLGPMYHLYTEEDKLQALREAIRVTKRGGVIFAAYCMSDASILQYGFLRGNIHTLMERNMLDPVTFKAFSTPQDIFELHRKADIDALRAHFPVTQLHFVAADGFAHYMRGTVENMDDDTFTLYLKYHLATCELPELTGYSNHTLDIFRRD